MVARTGMVAGEMGYSDWLGIYAEDEIGLAK